MQSKQTLPLFLPCDACGNGRVGLVLGEGEAVEEPLQLPAVYTHRLVVLVVGPLEASAFEAPIIKPEPVVVPGENFEFVVCAVAEDEEAAAKEVQLKAILHDCGKSIDGLAQIGASTGEIDVCAVGAA